ESDLSHRLCICAFAQLSIVTRAIGSDVCRGVACCAHLAGTKFSSARPQCCANLLEQLGQSRRIARRIPESRAGVELREFLDGRSEIRRTHRGGKLKRSLSFPPRHPPPRQHAQELRIQPRGKLRVRA